MEGKNVVFSVFIISLVLAQSHVEAKSCCPDSMSRNRYNVCRFTHESREICASLFGGTLLITGTECPSNYPRYTLKKSGDAVIEYCNLGCASSVCGALATLQNSDKSEIVNEAVETCTKACSTMCTKRSIAATETA